MSIDHGKLKRLQRDRKEAQAVMRDLNQQGHADRDDIQHAVLFFPASAAARAHWRPGDPVEAFLQMPADLAAQFPAEVRAAREIVQKRADLAAVMARVAELQTRYEALTKLTLACEQYARTQTQEA